MRHKFKRRDIASSVSRLWGHGETISEFYLEHIAQEYFDLQQKHAPCNPFVIQSLNLNLIEKSETCCSCLHQHHYLIKLVSVDVDTVTYLFRFNKKLHCIWSICEIFVFVEVPLCLLLSFSLVEELFRFLSL